MQFTGAGTTCALSGESRFIYIIMYCAAPAKVVQRTGERWKKGRKSKSQRDQKLERLDDWGGGNGECDLKCERERGWTRFGWLEENVYTWPFRHSGKTKFQRSFGAKENYMVQKWWLQSRFKTSAILKKTRVFFLCVWVYPTWYGLMHWLLFRFHCR